MLKILLMAIGCLSVGLGVIGIVLPILPTTPFMLLAAACFAKSSPRFHRWLLAAPVIGELITQWQTERYIAPKVKRRALLLIAMTFLISILLVGPWQLKIMLLCFWLVCSFFVARLPTIALSKRGQ